MSGLSDLLERMREHPAFPELVKTLAPPALKDFKPSSPDGQTQDWIFRSGRRRQHEIWLQFLTTGEAPQEKT